MAVKKLKMPQMCALNVGSTKNSINKENIPIRKSRIARYYPEYGICVLKPIIDKLEISYNLEDVIDQIDIEEYSAYLSKSFMADALHTDYYSYIPIHEKGKSRYRSYKDNVWLKHHDTNSDILIQFNPHSSKKPFIRLNFNPDKLRTSGMEFLREKIREGFSGDGFEINLDMFFKHSGAIEKIDVAVDVVGLHSDDVIITSMKAGHPEKTKTQLYKGLSGRMETSYPKLKKTSNDIKIYNKKQHLLEKGHSPKFGDVNHLRVERTILKPTVSVLDVAKIHNHFKKIDIKGVNHNTYPEKEHWHKLFMLYAKERGLEKALELCPVSLHQDYIDTYQKAAYDFWEPIELWGMLKDAVYKSLLIEPDGLCT